VFEVADLAEEFCDAGALGADFALGLGEKPYLNRT
jgi:hypothetical protein